MTNWTQHRVIIAVPATDGPAAAKLWRFLDPDEGGERTFHEPNYMRNGQPWIVACGQLEEELWAALRDVAPRVKAIRGRAMLRKRRLRRGEMMPGDAEVASLRTRMYFMRVPPDMTPGQILENAGFVRIKKQQP